MHSDRTMTVLAWCCLRADFRMFRADRIRDATPTGQSFRPRRVTLRRDHMVQWAEEDRTAPG